MSNLVDEEIHLSLHTFDTNVGTQSNGGFLFRYPQHVYNVCGWRVVNAFLTNNASLGSIPVLYISSSLPTAMVANHVNGLPRPIIACIPNTLGPISSFPYYDCKNVTPYDFNSITLTLLDNNYNILSSAKFVVQIEFWHKIKN
jgi:hypothetical protein